MERTHTLTAHPKSGLLGELDTPGILGEVLNAQGSVNLLELTQQRQRVVRGDKNHRGARLQLREGADDGTVTDSVRNSAHIELGQPGVGFTTAAAVGLSQWELLVSSQRCSFLMIASPKIAQR